MKAIAYDSHRFLIDPFGVASKTCVEASAFVMCLYPFNYHLPPVYLSSTVRRMLLSPRWAALILGSEVVHVFFPSKLSCSSFPSPPLHSWHTALRVRWSNPLDSVNLKTDNILLANESTCGHIKYKKYCI